jgi:protein SCO1/2
MSGASPARAALLLALCAFAAAAPSRASTGAAVEAPDQDRALRASQAAIGRQLPDLRLADQHGRALQLADLRGRPLVLQFVFTDCSFVCSGATLHLREVVAIARDALGDDRFSVLTVGFDSSKDTPEQMLAYARARGIDDPRWHFAAADAETVRQITAAAGFSWAPSAAGFDHIAQLTVVDARGRIVQQVYGPAFEPPALIEPLKSMVLGLPYDRSSARAMIDRLRLYCSAYDPVSRSYRVDYSMLLAAAPGLLVLAMAALAIVALSRRAR